MNYIYPTVNWQFNVENPVNNVNKFPTQVFAHGFSTSFVVCFLPQGTIQVGAPYTPELLKL